MLYIRTERLLFIDDSSIRHSSLSVVQFYYAYNMHIICGYVKKSTIVVKVILNRFQVFEILFIGITVL